MAVPMKPASAHVTPSSHATGANARPRMPWSVRSSKPTKAPSHPIKPLSMATRAMKAMSMAPTRSASRSPSAAPRAAASITFTSGRSTSSVRRPAVTGSPVSGTSSFAMTSAAGADMMEAAARCPAAPGTNGSIIAAYAAKTVPEIVASPAVMIAIITERVMPSTYGFTTSGDSIIPTKMFDAVHSVSAPEVRIVRCMIHAAPRTIRCMMPRWYSTVISDEMKMMLGRTRKAKNAPVRATPSPDAVKAPPSESVPTATSFSTRLPKTNRLPSSP